MPYVGIDYSGRDTATSRLSGLRVFTADGGMPEELNSPDSPAGRRYNWTRHGVAQWLMQMKANEVHFIAGIDHALSFPEAYFQAHELGDWAAFLGDFIAHWPTNEAGRTVEGLRNGNERLGDPNWYRLTEKWTSSSKSVFRFDVTGQVAKSTHAGLPWIHALRGAPGPPIHFWPFDGWDVPNGTSVIAEVYPSILRRRYATEGRSPDQQDAYVTARWLQECASRGTLDRYFHPPLTPEEGAKAQLEGWILGIC